MTTPNNAAALERLEQKWREEAAAEWTHCQNKELSEWVRDRCYGQHNRLLSCADELAALRATLTQPDALTSQPSGGGGAIGTLTVRRWRGIDAMVNHEFDYYGSLPDGSYSVYTHPSADAPGVAVVPASSLRELYGAYVRLLETGRDRIIELGGACDSVEAMERGDFDLHKARIAMDSCGTAALAPKPEGK